MKFQLLGNFTSGRLVENCHLPGAGYRSRDEEQTLLQFVSCSVHPLECVDMTLMTVQRDYKHRGLSVACLLGQLHALSQSFPELYMWRVYQNVYDPPQIPDHF